MWNRGHLFIWNTEGNPSPSVQDFHSPESETFEYIVCAGGDVYLHQEQIRSTDLNSLQVSDLQRISECILLLYQNYIRAKQNGSCNHFEFNLPKTI